MSEPGVAERLLAVRSRIADAARRAGRAESDVCLVAVSKKQLKESVLEAYRAGQRDFGENYVQALLLRKDELVHEDVRWHMIGHLQSNKAKPAAVAHMIHTVDSLRVAQALAKASEHRGGALPILIEVNVGAEDQKAGVPPDQVEALCVAVRQLPTLELRGLMCIPPEGEGRRHFAALRGLRDRLAAQTGMGLSELSMGMSEDYEDAILEGATLVRVGTAIFGPRPDV